VRGGREISDLKLAALEAHRVPKTLALWGRRWGGRFPLDLALWRQNTEGDPRHFQSDRCWVIEDGEEIAGCLALKVPGNPPAWARQDPQQAWISFLLVQPGAEGAVASPLLDRAVGRARGLGFERVAYGGDPSHFFPGAPEEDEPLRDVLREAGFQPGDVVHDLIGDLTVSRGPWDADRPLSEAGAAFGPCDRGTTPALLAFLDEHFPGRWAYETRRRLEVEPTAADILILTRGAEVIGFCHAYHAGSRRIGPSIYWRGAIGDRYGGLGPIGVAPAFRGRGIGFALLVLSVEHLHTLGVERAVIDWTTLTDFYGRLGFTVWRAYRPWRLDL